MLMVVRQDFFSFVIISIHPFLSNPTCRGIVTADVLMQGLSHGAITARKLKGVKRDKGHEDYTGSAPYVEGKSLLQLRWYCLGFR